jgi:hypothetical protein
MKPPVLILLAAGAACAIPSRTPARDALTRTTAVQTLPDPAAPVITYLKAGSEPVPTSDPTVNPPEGWIAVDVPGPFDGYVANHDLTKDLTVKPGSPVLFEPKAGAYLLTTAARDDKFTITGLRGNWTQVRLDRSLIGYIHPGSMPDSRAAAAPLTAPVEVHSTAPGKPAPEAGSGYDAGKLPRTFEGRFVSTRSSPLSPRRPYDWQITDENGVRRAYLDVGKLLLTEQMDKYVGHNVEVFGPARAVLGTNDIVVQVESLQLK